MHGPRLLYYLFCPHHEPLHVPFVTDPSVVLLAPKTTSVPGSAYLNMGPVCQRQEDILVDNQPVHTRRQTFTYNWAARNARIALAQ
jgi:hypothetical protein